MPGIAISKSFQSLILKLLVCFSVLLSLSYFGKTHFYRDPGSVFFDPSRALEQKYSVERREQIKDFAQSGAHTAKAGPNASLCLALSSVKRPHTQYLETAVASILHGLSARERSDLYLSITIAHSNPEIHPSWTSAWLRAAVDDFTTYNVSAAQLDRIKEMEASQNFQSKGISDYVHAMQRCYATGSPYVAMFEDDVLLADGWHVRTLLGLRNIPQSSKWLFMRLFVQDRSIGWESQVIGRNHEGFIILVVDLVILATAWCARRFWPATSRLLDWTTMAIVTLVFAPGLIVLFFQAGKISVLPHSAGVYNQPFGCCSQALVFPRDIVPRVVSFLEEKKSGQIDILLDQLAETSPLERYALYPDMVQHVGIDSARQTSREAAGQVWSVGFEDLVPARLEQDHRRMLQDYYGPS